MSTIVLKKAQKEENKKAEELKRRNTAFIIPVESPREKQRREMIERFANKDTNKEEIAPYKRKNKAILQGIAILTCHNTAVHMEAIQWVNLKKDKKNLDNVHTDIERLGLDVKLRIKIDLPNTEHSFVVEQKKRIAN